MKSDVGSDKTIESLARALISPDTFRFLPSNIVDVARQQGCASLLYRSCPSAELNNNIAKKLRNVSALWEGVSIVRQEAVHELLEKFCQHKVPVLLIKGIALGYQIYQSPGLRPGMDVDLLIEQDQIEPIKIILQQSGYHIHAHEKDSLITQQFSASQKLKSGHTLGLDIHYQLNNQQRYARLFNFDELSSRSAPIQQISPHARALGLSDAFLLACIHRAGHIAEGEPTRLIWLYDIFLLLRKMDSDIATETAALIQEKDLGEVCRSGISATMVYFPTSLPVALQKVVQVVAGENTKPENINPVSEIWYKFRYQTGWRQRLKFTRQLLFPSREHMQRKYPQSKTWLPLLYVHRAIGGFSRRIKTRATTKQK